MTEGMRIIAGPCQHESLKQSLRIAEECKRVCEKHGIEYYFKASFDKANRSSINGQRGLGLNATLHDFETIKDRLLVKTITDVHTVPQINWITEGFNDTVDALQIPAFLCRQTDLVQAACATDKIVNIKKGQFLAPWDIENILSKTEGAKEVWITERGTSFGYNTLVVDFTGMDYMLNNISADIVFDVTHSVQKPGGNGSSSGGNRDYVPGLCRAASALGIRNFFLEVHEDPDNAPSDGPNALHLKDFEAVVDSIVRHAEC
jgi:2-dehydro-3-deoxyphosphooctonate aldolase (KDO 8-P synthase)|tara:strand:- start:2965 stop:3747 length:783 start_codon:yes stop_codon:yes gene_type:complete